MSRATVIERNVFALHGLLGVAMKLQGLVAFLQTQTQTRRPERGFFLRHSEEFVVEAQNIIIWEDPSMFPQCERQAKDSGKQRVNTALCDEALIEANQGPLELQCNPADSQQRKNTCHLCKHVTG